ncbi:hypothetical protein CJO79_19245 (plasmid) [Ralstonia solanacearum]|nr:hypothetical protein CJO76_19260 [Ralstonia solanacearum]AXV93134.1 hypothetical protein CJO79_19245 [Ralstonia solanacearum]AXW21186.1 hypothetical protein CJO85_19315 [Ralstonia solanacearum]AXW78032.1 hypothetical protein CJO97_19240 [Ralstonia solanacearum]
MQHLRLLLLYHRCPAQASSPLLDILDDAVPFVRSRHDDGIGPGPAALRRKGEMRDAGPFTVAPGHRRVQGLAGVEAALQGHLRDMSGSAVSPARP